MDAPRRTALGEKGDDVKAWQEFLNSQGFNVGAADGIHGKGTEAQSVAYEESLTLGPIVPIEYTADQKRAIDAVLSIFETGRVPTVESYSTCTVLRDGAGISYGKHQCTDKAGSLDLVCKRYITLGGEHADSLQAYMGYLATNESSKVDPGGPFPGWLSELIALLKKAGADPVMQQAQDEVFDENYFKPAVKHAEKLGLTKALSLLVMYDTCIHSGPGRVPSHCEKITEPTPRSGGDEKAYITQYVAVRRAWLAGSSNALVQKCVYRPDAISKLIQADNWDLTLPFNCHGRTVS